MNKKLPLKNKAQHIPIYSTPTKVLTEMLVSLHHAIKNCRFTWELDIEAASGSLSWHIEMSVSLHAKVTRKHKDIKPRQLYSMVFDAFFGSVHNGDDLANKRRGTHLAASSNDTCQFDYFFCPQDRFQYGNESKMRKAMERYRDWMNQSLGSSDKYNAAGGGSLVNNDADDLLNTAFAMPRAPNNDMIVQIALRSAYEDDKFFFFILKPRFQEQEQQLSGSSFGMGIQAPSLVEKDVSNQQKQGSTSLSPLATNLGASNSPAIPHSATTNDTLSIPQATQRSFSVGSAPNTKFNITTIDSLSRRVNNLESENAELRALTHILKQQNIEMQEDLKSFQKALLLLTEKNFEKHKLSYKEFNSIAKQFSKQGRVSSNIIHHVEALTISSVKGLTPRKLHLIYNRFKSLLPYHEDERYSTTDNHPNSSSSTHLLDVRKKARDLQQQFSAHHDRFVADICGAWVYSTSLGQPDKAMDIFINLLSSDAYQSSVFSPQKLAFVSFSRARLQSDAQLALKDYNDAIRHNPTFFPSYINRANLYHYKLESPEQALSDYSVAIHYDSSDYSVFYNRGILYFKSSLDNPTLALKDFNRALELNPKHSHSYNNRALLYKTKLNDPIRALQSLDDAIKHDPQYFALWVNRAHLMFESLQAPEEALKNFSNAIRLNPKYADTYVDRGIVHASLERNEEALVDFKQALRLNGDHVLAQEMYRKMQEKLGMVGKGVK